MPCLKFCNQSDVRLQHFLRYDYIAEHYVIQELVLKIQQEVAPLVLVFKLLPRCCDRDKDAMLTLRSLNKKLAATLKCILWVHILNLDLRSLCGMLYYIPIA